MDSEIVPIAESAAPAAPPRRVSLLIDKPSYSPRDAEPYTVERRVVEDEGGEAESPVVRFEGDLPGPEEEEWAKEEASPTLRAESSSKEASLEASPESPKQKKGKKGKPKMKKPRDFYEIKAAVRKYGVGEELSEAMRHAGYPGFGDPTPLGSPVKAYREAALSESAESLESVRVLSTQAMIAERIEQLRQETTTPHPSSLPPRAVSDRSPAGAPSSRGAYPLGSSVRSRPGRPRLPEVPEPRQPKDFQDQGFSTFLQGLDMDIEKERESQRSTPRVADPPEFTPGYRFTSSLAQPQLQYNPALLDASALFSQRTSQRLASLPTDIRHRSQSCEPSFPAGSPLETAEERLQRIRSSSVTPGRAAHPPLAPGAHPHLLDDLLADRHKKEFSPSANYSGRYQLSERVLPGFSLRWGQETGHVPGPEPPPRRPKKVYERLRRTPPPPVEDSVPSSPEPEEVFEWDIDFSVFAPRRSECDARGYYDTMAVVNSSLELDWRRAAHKQAFRQLVMRQDADLKPIRGRKSVLPTSALVKPEVGKFLQQGLEDVMAEMKAVFAASGNYELVLRAYRYFCQMDSSVGEAAYSMGLNAFNTFLKDTEILDNKGCKQNACDTMFTVTNFEEAHPEEETEDMEAQSAKRKGNTLTRRQSLAQARRQRDVLAQANDDRALMRFEFLEIIVRLALAKFGRESTSTPRGEGLEPPQAVQALFDLHICPHLDPLAIVDTNDFRRRRLYCEEMDQLYTKHRGFMTALYGYACKRPMRTGPRHLMGQEQWTDLLETLGLVGRHTGVSKREAKHVFTFSQMRVIDDIRTRDRFIGITYVDFLEAIARLSDLISPPDERELDAFFSTFQSAKSSFASDSRVWTYFREMADPRSAPAPLRESSGLLGAPTRPLHVKTAQVLEVMIYELMFRFRVQSEISVTNRLAATK